MIDFAKTVPRYKLVAVSTYGLILMFRSDPVFHNREWEPGENNFEDGYLTGLFFFIVFFS